jgi:hypothetical protein
MAQRGGFRQRISGFEIDRTILGIIAAGATLIGALLFPKLYPAAQRGPSCSDLASPIGGNNRSVLAYLSTNSNPLNLDLSLAKTTIDQNETLEVRLTFVNQDRGPVIIHFRQEGPILTSNAAVQGVTLEITRVDGGQVADQPDTYTSPTTFPYRELNLLGSRDRCTERYSITPTELAALGIGTGEYRIRAAYRNNSRGDPGPLQPLNATATPIPQYADNQGVWVGEVESNEVRFAIVVPGQPGP